MACFVFVGETHLCVNAELNITSAFPLQNLCYCQSAEATNQTQTKTVSRTRPFTRLIHEEDRFTPGTIGLAATQGRTLFLAPVRVYKRENKNTTGNVLSHEPVRGKQHTLYRTR